MDRLSGLPDDVIFRILSFLPAKSFVRTSILAKVWRFHWAHVPCFGFETTKIMTFNNPPANNFHVGFGTSDREFESWIANVLECNVRNLVTGPYYQLPRRLFACETLVCLRIIGCAGIPDPKDGAVVNLPALKKLELVNVGYEPRGSLPHLLSGCPVLEELTIQRMKAVCCDVSSPSLTRLVVDIDEVQVLQLQNPSLRYLHLRDRTMSKCIVAKAPTYLVEADVDLMNEGDFNYSRSVIEFVCKLYNVTRLKLSTRPMDAVYNLWFSDWDVRFHNLTQLSLRTDWRFITSFLETANNLRVLTITRMVDPNTQYWTRPKLVPACLESRLETVNIIDFEWSREHEFDMVKYILRNANVLKNMEMICTQNYELDSDVKRRAINIIAMFETVSPTCQINFVSFV